LTNCDSGDARCLMKIRQIMISQIGVLPKSWSVEFTNVRQYSIPKSQFVKLSHLMNSRLKKGDSMDQIFDES